MRRDALARMSGDLQGGWSCAPRLTAACSCALVGLMLAAAVAWAQQEPRTPPRNPAIRILVVKTESEARDAAAQHAAGLAFDQIVRERSLGPERERGGYLGRIDVSSLSPAAQAALANTRPGRLTPVFATESGFGVIQVLTDREAAEEEARLQREPEALEALKRGTDLGTQGDLEGAAKSLQRAVELNPKLLDAHFNLAVALARLGRQDAAIAAMQEVVRLQPKDFDAQMRLATWLGNQGRHAEAVLHLERAAALDVNSQDVWLKLAQSYEAAGRTKAALGAYRRVHGLLGRDDPEVLKAVLRTAAAASDGPAAVDAARRLRASQPGHDGLVILGDALMLNGELEAAAREYRMAVGLAPKSARAHARLAAALSGTGQPEPAADHLLRAIQLEPTNPEYYGTLSALYERTGRLDLAIVALRDGGAAAANAPRTTQAEFAERLAALYDRAHMRREAEQERARAKLLRGS